MNEKRFRVNDLVKYDYSEIGEYIDENHTDKPIRNDEVCNLLNELSDENRQLQEEIKRLEKMIWKIQWRFQQEVGIEKAREHYREIDKEMED